MSYRPGEAPPALRSDFEFAAAVGVLSEEDALKRGVGLEVGGVVFVLNVQY